MNELDKLMRIKLEDCRGYPKSENEVNASDAEASSEVINPLPANVVNASDDAAAAEAITEMINNHIEALISVVNNSCYSRLICWIFV